MPENLPNVLLPYYPNRNNCIICGIHKNAIVGGAISSNIPKQAIIDLFTLHGILIGVGRWFCTAHKHQGVTVDNDDAEQLALYIATRAPNGAHHVESYRRSLQYIIKHYQQSSLQNNQLEEYKRDHECKISLDNLSDEHVRHWCRLARADLINLSQTFDVDINKLFIFYTKCYRNPPYRFMSAMFGRPKSTLCDYFNEVLDTLTSDDNLVTKELNTVWTRAMINDNTPEYAKDMYELSIERIMLMTDGTMFYIHKPSHFNRQKRSYAKHKKRNCLAILPFMCLNGRYVLNIGPFYGGGDNSDEYLFKSIRDWDYIDWCRTHPNHPNCMFDDEMIERIDHLNYNLYFNDSDDSEADDYMLADRGFGRKGNRDRGLECPANLNPPKKRGKKKKKSKRKVRTPKRKQLPAAEANRTRMVVYLRHTAERNYSRIKQWDIVQGVILWQHIKKLRRLVDVLMSTENRYFVEMIEDDPNRQKLSERIMAHQDGSECQLQQHVPLTYAIRELKVWCL